MKNKNILKPGTKVRVTTAAYREIPPGTILVIRRKSSSRYYRNHYLLDGSYRKLTPLDFEVVEVNKTIVSQQLSENQTRLKKLKSNLGIMQQLGLEEYSEKLHTIAQIVNIFNDKKSTSDDKEYAESLIMSLR